MNFNWAFLDLETTGLDSSRDKVTEIAIIIKMSDGTRKTYETFVNPGVSVPAHITDITGIDDSMLINAPYPEEILDKVSDLLKGKVIVAHNASFDQKFLENMMGETLNNRWIDTLELTKILFSKVASYSLRYLIRKFNLECSPSHRALADTEALEKLFFYLLEKANSFSLQDIQEIYYCLKDEERGLSLLFEDILNGKLISYNFNQPITYKKSKKKDSIENCNGRKLQEWSPEELVKMFKPEGVVARGLKAYQERPEQIEMMRAVAKAFSQERYLLVEAGTGVGKSLAYLVPSLAWAITHQEKVVVATHTIALQEQLFRNDIKFLKQNLPFFFKAAVLKGRSNYLCLYKWKLIKDKITTLNWSEKIFLARIANWVSKDGTGDKDTIALKGWEQELFSQMSSSRESCLGAQCPFTGECFYQRAKEKANGADVIIVNHSLLLSDAKIGDYILPKYNYLVIDEAHHLEDEGTRQFTETFSLREFQKKINQLVRKKGAGFRKPGLLYIWSNYRALPPEMLPEVKKLVKAAEEIARTIIKKTDDLNQYVLTQRQFEKARINMETRSQKGWENLKILFENVFVHTEDFLNNLYQLHNRLAEDCSETKWEDSLKDLMMYRAEIKEDLGLAKRFFNTSEEKYTYWMEVNQKRNELFLYITPVDIGEIFNELLFSVKTAAILTSATLCIGEKFNFLLDRLGLMEDLVDTQRISSPFAYEEQSLLLIDNSLPDSVSTSEEVYNLALKEALLDILKATNGRTLVLFTAHRQLQSVYKYLKKPLQNKGIEIYADGIDGNRTTLLEEMRDNSSAVIFGTNTFWEGIDLPGDFLTAVIIVKLPFWPPNLPLVEARVEAIQKEGKDGFYNYSLPQAVLRFRQGYGRLIRSVNDWGVVVILDNRLVKKRYGKVFLKSLPQNNYIIGDTNKIVENILNWFKKFS